MKTVAHGIDSTGVNPPATSSVQCGGGGSTLGVNRNPRDLRSHAPSEQRLRDNSKPPNCRFKVHSFHGPVAVAFRFRKQISRRTNFRTLLERGQMLYTVTPLSDSIMRNDF